LRLAVPIAFTTVAFLAAGTWYVRHDTPPEAAHAPAAPAAAPRIVVASHVPTLRIVATNALPDGRPTLPLSSFCEGEAIAPATSAGKLAAASGWHVDSEQPLGRYVVVGIFANAGNATSGACMVQDASLAIFSGEHLVAIVYDPAANSDEGWSESGKVVPTADPARLRIWPGFVGGPTADLVLTTQGLEIVDFPATTTYCANQVQVANVFGRELVAARTALLADGWEPQPPAEPAENVYVDGLPEVQDCAGTGFAFCGALYRHSSGAQLSVQTVGENVSVMDYEVTCPGDAPAR
jgi:hypothetical protein